MSTKEGVRFLAPFISFISNRGDQPGPPSPERAGHKQIPTASTSYWVRDGSDIFVGNMSIVNNGGVNPSGVMDRTMLSCPLMCIYVGPFVTCF